MKEEENKSRKELVEQLLRKHKVKKIQLAEILGVSPSFITLVIKGLRNLPLDRAEQLLKGGIPPEVVRPLVNAKYSHLIDKLAEE